MSKILVVDDEEKIRDVVVAYLLKAGFETCEAGDGHHALLQLESNKFHVYFPSKIRNIS